MLPHPYGGVAWMGRHTLKSFFGPVPLVSSTTTMATTLSRFLECRRAAIIGLQFRYLSKAVTQAFKKFLVEPAGCRG
jgi:hypothetical protein